MKKNIKDKEPVFIIAEAGVNHNGNIKNAFKLIDIASSSGADAVKFQTWKTELLMTKYAKTSVYQKNNTKIDSQFEMAKKLELSYMDFMKLKKYCDLKNIMFLSTPDDIKSAKFLINLQDIFKIGSGEINNILFLRYVGSLKKKIILSTGMSKLDEIRKAISILINAGTKKKDITVLHCNSAYPTPFKDVNLKAMLTIKKKFNVRIGYSDHTIGNEVSLAAVARTVAVIPQRTQHEVAQSKPHVRGTPSGFFQNAARLKYAKRK